MTHEQMVSTTVNFYFGEYKVSAQVLGATSEYGIFGSEVSRLTVSEWENGLWKKLVSYERDYYFRTKISSSELREIVNESIHRAKENGSEIDE